MLRVDSRRSSCIATCGWVAAWRIGVRLRDFHALRPAQAGVRSRRPGQSHRRHRPPPCQAGRNTLEGGSGFDRPCDRRCGNAPRPVPGCGATDAAVRSAAGRAHRQGSEPARGEARGPRTAIGQPNSSRMVSAMRPARFSLCGACTAECSTRSCPAAVRRARICARSTATEGRAFRIGARASLSIL